MKTTLLLMAVLCMATIAQAAISVQFTGEVDMGDGLCSTTACLVSDTLANAAVSFSGGFQVTIGMNQVLAFGALSTPTMTNAAFLAPADLAKDSHFLLTDADLIPVTAPAETATTLTGAFGIQPSAVKQVLPLAQFIGPAHSLAFVQMIPGSKAGNSQGILSALLGAGPFETWPPLYAGDANSDGTVSVGDLGILAANYGATGLNPLTSWGKGDFNTDGKVDVGDLGMLAANYGWSSPVPEPATLALLAAGTLALRRRGA